MDLSPACGLPVSLETDLRLLFTQGLPEVRPQPRTLEELRPVLYNQTAPSPAIVYWMYRGAGWPADARRAGALGLRYDLTVLTPERVGGEYPKTFGHHHPPMPGSTRTYPELYQVVLGTAHCLMQRPPDDGRPDEVVVVEAGPGQLILIPPGYAHLTINRGPDPLVLANWVAEGFTADYEAFRRRRGAAYYEVEHEGRAYFVPNGHYSDPPRPRLVEPLSPAHLGLEPGEPLYQACRRDPERLAFLSDPGREVPPAGN
ncbi:MAG: glucose-6-phosphate isomerase family protein [bacterium]|nr:glucose-6-phosphate isomerase family protein [bacterium]